MKIYSMLYCVVIVNCFFIYTLTCSEKICLTLGPIHTIEDAKNSLEKLKNPISKEKQKDFLKDVKTGNPLLDKGLLQFVVYEKYCDEIEKGKIPQHKEVVDKSNKDIINHNREFRKKNDELVEKIQSYFLYRISKHMMQTVIRCLSKPVPVYASPTHQEHFFYVAFLQSWIWLYEDLRWFAQKDNRRYLTPMAVFNYAFMCNIFLDCLDLQQPGKHKIVFPLVSVIYKQCGQGSNNSFLFEPNPLLMRFSGLQETDEIPLSLTKKWCRYPDQFILPFLGKTSFIGLIPLILTIIRGYCSVGIGIQFINVHNGHYKDRASILVHDILHFNLETDNRNAAPGKNRLLGHFSNIFPALIAEYQKDTSQVDLLKCFFSIFMFTHELILYQREMTKEGVLHSLNNFFKLPGLKNMYLDSVIDYDILFNFSDTFSLYMHAYPKLTELLLKNKLTLKDGLLKSAKNKKIKYKQMLPMIGALVYCVIDSWHELLKKYGNEIGMECFTTEELNRITSQFNIDPTDFL